METLADRFKLIRGDMSQQEFADNIGVNRNIIADIERGKTKKPNKYIIEKLEKKFHINPQWLLTGKGEIYLKKPSEFNNQSNSVEVEILTVRPSAGKGSNLEAIDDFESGKKLYIDKMLFKKPPNGRVWAMQVDGYSMVPMLFPDSWVLVDETKNFTGDGLYVINFDNILMVKLLEINLNTGNLWVKSVNPDYDSWEIKSDDQRHFEIIGKVVRCII